jgi:hypothetical protein
LSRLRARNQFEMNRSKFQLSLNSRTTRLDSSRVRRRQ